MSLIELKESIRGERPVLDNLPVPTLVISTETNTAGQIVLVNSAAQIRINKLLDRDIDPAKNAVTIFQFLPPSVTKSPRNRDLFFRMLLAARRNEQHKQRSQPRLTLVGGIPIEIQPTPIRDKNHKIIGIRAVIFDRQKEENEKKGLKRKLSEREKVRRQLQALKETAEALNKTKSYAEFMHNLGEIILTLPGDTANIMLIDKRGKIKVSQSWGYEKGDVPKPLPSSPEYTVNKMRTLKNMYIFHNPVNIPDTRNHPWWKKGKGGRRKRWLSYLGVPIIVEGKVIGFLNFNGRKLHQFNSADEHTAIALADQIGFAFQRGQLYEELAELARTDEITGLPNRRETAYRFDQTIENALRTKRDLGIALFDIDNFGAIDKIEGEEAGDQILGQLARRAKRKIRRTDIVGRWGGEEFIVIPGNNSRKAGLVLARKIKRGFDNLQPVNIKKGGTSKKHRITWIKGQKVKVTATFGVATLSEIKPPDLKLNYNQLIKYYRKGLIELADDRVNEGKKRGRNRIVYDYIPNHYTPGVE